jgi:hypothetical protein
LSDDTGTLAGLYVADAIPAGRLDNPAGLEDIRRISGAMADVAAA